MPAMSSSCYSLVNQSRLRCQPKSVPINIKENNRIEPNTLIFEDMRGMTTPKRDNGKQVMEVESAANPGSVKKRQLTLKVWQDFEKFIGPNKNDIAKCKQCKKKIVGRNTKETIHLRNHLGRCVVKKRKAKGQ
ncbi:unnamed protein product [Dovyalis caffra]|uniref:BED-type domain-containing protein n=1 Tax=Dovyalis caffra TaxID=77055 RepID=A0AAV1RJH3_9ROSI|nr:unnamed protein product [Dovyalis caffra]